MRTNLSSLSRSVTHRPGRLKIIPRLEIVGWRLKHERIKSDDLRPCHFVGKAPAHYLNPARRLLEGETTSDMALLADALSGDDCHSRTYRISTV